MIRRPLPLPYALSVVSAGLLAGACGQKPAPPAPAAVATAEPTPASAPAQPETSKGDESPKKPDEEPGKTGEAPAVRKTSAEDLARIATVYGRYVLEREKDDPGEAKVYQFSLEPGTLVCNGSNHSIERRTYDYYVVEASPRRFRIAFEETSANRTLTFGYDEAGKLSVEEGHAPGDCHWSLRGGTWVQTEALSGAAPTELRALPKPAKPSSDKISVGLAEDASGKAGAIRARAFSWKKKIGFSEADEDEKFGQLSIEVRNDGQDAIDFELAHPDADEMISFSCQTGGETGDVGSCERPHFGDQTVNGLIPAGRKMSFNHCRKFEKDSSGCKALIDLRTIGGGIAEVDLGK